MEALLWSDYLCPWCYLGRDRTAMLEERGVDVVHLPFELHPEIPPEGRRIRPDGRLQWVFDSIEAECVALGIPFRRPERVPNTHRALECAEVVRLHFPDSFDELDQLLFTTYWVEGGDLGDVEVVDALLQRAGAPVEEVEALLSERVGERALETSMHAAHERGVYSTPSWVIGQALLPGAQPRATFERWITRLLGRTEPTGSPVPSNE